MRYLFGFLMVLGQDFIPVYPTALLAQQVTGQDVDKILERADKLLEEAKAAYEDASSKAAVAGFIDAGFKLEEARIKYLVLQEVGSPDKQKLAADRLRAINQLSKLIHDGKVAVGGTPAEPAPAKPIEPNPGIKDPSPIPAVPPAKAPVDVSKRAPVPEAKRQQEAEKLIKDLFKDQYSKKTPADRKALARLLLAQAAKSQEDPVAVWVLCREAQDMAVQSCDIGAVLEAIEAVARLFDVDSMSMRNAALTATAKMAKAPDEYSALSEALQSLINEFVRADQYDSADKAATSAVQFARSSKDADLLARAMTRAKEVAEAKTLFQSMKRVMETQAKNPDDPAANLEIGRFLCFVKGSWDLGLRFIVKGSDAALKALAEKELAFPPLVEERVGIADGWYDLAEKEKSPLRKSQMLAHAKTVYESALPDAVALVRARIEKRLADIAKAGVLPVGPGTSPTDLLTKLDPKSAISGQASLSGGTLSISSSGTTHGRFPTSFSPQEEYDLSLTVERKGQSGELLVGVLGGGRQFTVHFDSGGVQSGVASTGRTLDQEDGLVKGPFFGKGPRFIVFLMRKKGLTVRVDGKDFLTFKVDDWSRVICHPNLAIADKKVLFLGCLNGSFQVTKAMVSSPKN
jgi:hypothetical protein